MSSTRSSGSSRRVDVPPLEILNKMKRKSIQDLAIRLGYPGNMKTVDMIECLKPHIIPENGRNPTGSPEWITASELCIDPDTAWSTTSTGTYGYPQVPNPYLGSEIAVVDRHVRHNVAMGHVVHAHGNGPVVLNETSPSSTSNSETDFGGILISPIFPWPIRVIEDRGPTGRQPRVKVKKATFRPYHDARKQGSPKTKKDVNRKQDPIN